MNEFISLYDVSQENYHELKEIQKELNTLNYDLKRRMDSGLTPDDMHNVTAAQKAVQAAGRIVGELSQNF